MAVSLDGYVSGHPDGILDVPMKDFSLDSFDERFRKGQRYYLLEVTAPNHFSFQRIAHDGLKAALHQKYVQLQIYLATPEVSHYANCCIVEVKNKNTSELYEEGISYDQETVTIAIERAKRVDEMTSKGIVSTYRCDDWRMNTCRYRELCFPEELGLVPSMRTDILRGESLTEVEELRGAAEMWHKGKDMSTDGKDLVEEARDYFRSIVEEYGARGLTVGDVKAMMVESIRRSIPMDILKQKYPDVYEELLTTEPSRYIRVT
jgi:hypothetical protein